MMDDKMILDFDSNRHYFRWFDVMFLVAATCSIALLYLGHTRDKGEQGSSLKDE